MFWCGKFGHKKENCVEFLGENKGEHLVTQLPPRPTEVVGEVELERSVAEYSSISGGWAWDRLDNLLAQDTKENIVASPCPKSNAGRDLVAWSLTNDGEFSSWNFGDVKEKISKSIMSISIGHDCHYFVRNILNGRSELISWKMPHQGEIAINIDYSVSVGSLRNLWRRDQG
ncbi:hypothetical protein JHK87_012343 [Glycine soja]|nr:hypothetical protein JHK87_012343 [Glycine soja]